MELRESVSRQRQLKKNVFAWKQRQLKKNVFAWKQKLQKLNGSDRKRKHLQKPNACVFKR